MKTKLYKNIHRGSDFSDFLAEEGIRPDVEVLALKRVVALELQQILEQEHITKTQLASRMKTSRASLDRILPPPIPHRRHPWQSRCSTRSESRTAFCPGVNECLEG